MADKTLVAQIAEMSLYSQKVNKLSTQKKVSQTNQKDAQNAERQENNKDLIKIKKTSC